MNAENQGAEETAPENGPRASGESGPTLSPQQLPQPNFESAVSMFSTQAMVALGLIPNPVTKQPDLQLHLAKHFIDLIGVLEEKTKGNLNQDEATVLQDSLHHLRMAYTHLKSTQG